MHFYNWFLWIQASGSRRGVFLAPRHWPRPSSQPIDQPPQGGRTSRADTWCRPHSGSRRALPFAERKRATCYLLYRCGVWLFWVRGTQHKWVIPRRAHLEAALHPPAPRLFQSRCWARPRPQPYAPPGSGHIPRQRCRSLKWYLRIMDSIKTKIIH